MNTIPSSAPVRLIAWLDRFCRPTNSIAVIIAAWTILVLPLVFFRGFNSDEGVAVTIARSALEDGNWLTPHMFNTRFVERPTLLSWIIEAVSAPFGGVSQVTARLPVALFVLGGCLLIYALLRRLAATPAAALLGAMLFLATPLVVTSYVMVTADLPLAVLLFLAFVLWWDGHATDRLGLGRWIAIGVVLALAGLMKGPQPVAYFALGVGFFVLLSRSWRQIPGLMLAGTICVIPLAAWYWHVYVPGVEGQWASFMRLRAGAQLDGPLEAIFEIVKKMLPLLLFAGAFLWSEGFRGQGRVPPAFVKAALCYALVASVFVAFWPGGSHTRYFFPMVLPMCALGGLAYDALAARRPQILAPLICATSSVILYSLVYVAASPLLPVRFRSSKLDAAEVTRLVSTMPAPIYRTGATGLNVLPYVPGRILEVRPEQLETIKGPAWMAIPAIEADKLLAKRPHGLRAAKSFEWAEEWRLLYVEP